MIEQYELDELPAISWRAKVSPSMDRRDQLRLYREAVGLEASRRQVRLRREELARKAWSERRLKAPGQPRD